MFQRIPKCSGNAVPRVPRFLRLFLYELLNTLNTLNTLNLGYSWEKLETLDNCRGAGLTMREAQANGS